MTLRLKLEANVFFSFAKAVKAKRRIWEGLRKKEMNGYLGGQEPVDWGGGL